MSFPMKAMLLICIWMVFSSAAQAQVDLETFRKIKILFEAEFNPELSVQNESIIINRPPGPGLENMWWDQEARHASYSSYTHPDGKKEHYLFLFGGYARIEGMTEDGVIATLCHELGHGIGGAPYKEKSFGPQASTEGQSDYYATRYCLKRVLKKWAPAQPIKAPTAYTEKLCRDRFTNEEELLLCFRGFQTLEAERLFFRLNDSVETNYETPDLSVVETMNLDETFYPSPQCRLDTMMAGILELERPRCWWAP